MLDPVDIHKFNPIVVATLWRFHLLSKIENVRLCNQSEEQNCFTFEFLFVDSYGKLWQSVESVLDWT